MLVEKILRCLKQRKHWRKFTQWRKTASFLTPVICGHFHFLSIENKLTFIINDWSIMFQTSIYAIAIASKLARGEFMIINKTDLINKSDFSHSLFLILRKKYFNRSPSYLTFVIFFYTYTFKSLKMLHPKVHNFATKYSTHSSKQTFLGSFWIFYTCWKYFTPTPQVAQVTNIRYGPHGHICKIVKFLDKSVLKEFSETKQQKQKTTIMIECR